jgi:DNA repair exonuclease SbcCD nuclease subunit
MKAVIISDTHLGKYKYGKVDVRTGLDLRTNDILKNIDSSIDFAIENKVDCFFIDGDFYHIKKPAPIFRKLLAARFGRILSSKIKLFLVLGNHDQGKTIGHDLVELFEMGSHIENLYVIDKPQMIEIEDCALCFLPHVNKIEFNLERDSYFEFFINSVKELTESAKSSKKKQKLFFGHFGTDKSVTGNSFDLGFVKDKSERVVPLDSFDKEVWTKVYLGDIHLQQELNSFCRHVGSIARVDFGEESDQKGFYFYDNGKDSFIKLDDRKFKTLEVDLTNNARETMGEFCSKVQDEDLKDSIVRIKITVKSSDRVLISFKALEEYLKENSWNYIGKSITEINDNDLEIEMMNEEDHELNHMDVFEKFMEMTKYKIDEKIYNDVMIEGKKILSEIINTSVK